MCRPDPYVFPTIKLSLTAHVISGIHKIEINITITGAARLNRESGESPERALRCNRLRNRNAAQAA